MKWPETVIDTPQGKRKAAAPLVISASRATDIPAFHAEWFMNRLKAGWCVWENPFNAAQKQWISFDKCRVFVFWSKHPAPLLRHLPDIASRGHEFYVQYTLNDYEGTGLEPNLPPLARRVETFRQLSELAGKKRVIWRFDPIILGGGLTVENTLLRLGRLAEALSPFTEKMVFSFVDWYRKTARELGRLDRGFRPPTLEEMQQIARGIAEMNRALPHPLKLATCAESIDLRGLGIEHNRCVDPALLHRLCPDCETFARWCGKERGSAQLSLLDSFSAPRTGAGNVLRERPGENLRGNAERSSGECGNSAAAPGTMSRTERGTGRGETEAPRASATGEGTRAATESTKDPGQRSACGCAPSKDIGAYKTCRHFCAYCYANSSKQTVERTLAALRPDDEKL